MKLTDGVLILQSVQCALNSSVIGTHFVTAQALLSLTYFMYYAQCRLMCFSLIEMLKNISVKHEYTWYLFTSTVLYKTVRSVKEEAYTDLVLVLQVVQRWCVQNSSIIRDNSTLKLLHHYRLTTLNCIALHLWGGPGLAAPSALYG